MVFADIALARRLELAEGFACSKFAEAQRRLFPDSGAEWMEHAGVRAVFNGTDSPVTQTFGLGLFGELRAETLDTIERFFKDRGASVVHEVSPLAGVGALDLLCSRNYRPVEVSSILYRIVEKPWIADRKNISARLTNPEEASVWSSVSVRGWSHEYPALRESMIRLSAISSGLEQGLRFLGEFAGEPGAAGVLFLHEGVALFGGSTTVPEMRRRGLQTALLEERMLYALAQGAELAMMVAEAGSNSQRNAERQGFRIAYTRTKWRLAS